MLLSKVQGTGPFAEAFSEDDEEDDEARSETDDGGLDCARKQVSTRNQMGRKVIGNSLPKETSKPLFMAHSSWKYPTANPPVVRPRLIAAATAPEAEG